MVGAAREQKANSISPRTVSLLAVVGHRAGSPALIETTNTCLWAAGIVEAVANHDTAALFAWLVGLFNFQGVSDRAAAVYIGRHGAVAFADLAAALTDEAPRCPKLAGFAAFTGCQYRKHAGTCSTPEHLAGCPVSRLPLRNGRLNQAAVSLWFFLRDVCRNDLVGWIDRGLATYRGDGSPEALVAARDALVTEFARVFGVGRKVVSMSLADLLLGGAPDRPDWQAVGAAMVAVDRHVHNFLHRTGTLARDGRPHAVGATCYRPGGCADILDRAARRLDARAYNSTFPVYFPRFFQHAVWRFCARDHLDICNGVAIDDRSPCRRTSCPLSPLCDRVPLRPPALGGSGHGLD